MSTPLTVATPGAQLTLHDRCDRCGAEARTIALYQDRQPLLFCGHHAKRHVIQLLAQGWKLSHKETP